MTKPVLLKTRNRPEKDVARAATGRFCVFIFELLPRPRRFRNRLSKCRKQFGAIAIGRVMSASRRNIQMPMASRQWQPNNRQGGTGNWAISSTVFPKRSIMCCGSTKTPSSRRRSTAAQLNAIADLMVRDDLSYVRLVPLKRNIPGRVIEFGRRMLDNGPLRLISFSEPYY